MQKYMFLDSSFNQTNMLLTDAVNCAQLSSHCNEAGKVNKTIKNTKMHTYNDDDIILS